MEKIQEIEKNLAKEESKDDDSGMGFDDLVNEQEFTGIRDRQQSCYAKDLNKDETPDFLKNNLAAQNGGGKERSATINQLMFVVPADDSIQRYKESLLGDLSGNVKRATMLGNSLPRKYTLKFA